MKRLLVIVFAIASASASAQQTFYDVTAGDGNGLRFWSSDSYKIHMGRGSDYQYGSVTDYSIKLNMNNDPARGWTWGTPGVTPIAALNTQGHFQIAGNFTVGGDIVVPSVGGNKQIYTWSSGDGNWRIGMSVSPGFTKSLTSAHTQYLTYSNGPGQGFAVGVNGGQSSFEVQGSDHTAFFRGKVGFGTSTPAGKVDINSAGGQLRLSGGTVAGGIWTNAQDILYLADWSTGTKGLNINMTSGNVGLGISNPSTKLSFGTSVQSKLLSLYDDPNDWYGLGIQGYQMRLQVGTANARFSFYAGDNAELMTIKGNGNVGIGTTSPNQKLTVNGTIYGKEVKVDLNVPGPDYVFEKNYKLLSLEEIKSYIDQHKHLPEVPSAKQMEQNGINLSEMNIILLKKVEELTLYVIDLKKENQEIKKQLEKKTKRYDK
jgi:hypothetical protein